MPFQDGLRLVVLAMIWGASFLFMRIAAPALGPVWLVFSRVGIAALCLLPWLLAGWRDRANLAHSRQLWLSLMLMALFNSALPFLLYGWSALHIPAGVGAVVNATAPLWTAVVGFVWLRDRLPGVRVFGLALGFLGVLVLVWSRGALGAGGDLFAILAMTGATACYGFAANLTKLKLGGFPPLYLAAMSQFLSTLWLLPLVAWTPAPHALAWRELGAMLMLGVFCTGIAYMLFFRLIANVGAARAVSVTFLVPVFGMLWGVLFLGETVGPDMLVAAAIILTGTALATGVWNPVPAKRHLKSS